MLRCKPKFSVAVAAVAVAAKAAVKSATAESAAKTAAMEATAMESAAEAPTGISPGRCKGTERGYRGEGNHRFTKHDNLLHNDVRCYKRCRRRIVAPGGRNEN